MRALAATFGTVVALFPTAANAAPTPSPSAMRAALPDPLESGFIEYPVGSSTVLEGPFDAKRYSDSVGSKSVLLALQQNGFVTGYGRDWYVKQGTDWMEELVMVFASDLGAETTAGSSKGAYARDSRTRSFFNPELNDGAYGLTVDEGRYLWSVIIFTKGNDMFVIERGSTAGYGTMQAQAQAGKVFAVSPDRFDVPARSDLPFGVSIQNVRLIAIGGVVVALMIAAAIAVVLLLVFRPRLQREEAKP